MNPRIVVRRTACLFAASLLAGCGPIMDLDRGPRIYGGVRADVQLSSGVLHVIPAGLFALDLPFSLVLDTLLLPVTIMVELFFSEARDEAIWWSETKLD